MLRDDFISSIRVRLIAYVSSKGIGELASDVAQDTLVVLLQRYSHIDNEAELIPLAFGICARKIHEARRFLARGGDGSTEMAELRSFQPSPYDEFEGLEVRVRLKHAVRRLSGRCRELMRLRLLGLSAAEIAAQLKTTPATLYVWKHRCHKNLIREWSR